MVASCRHSLQASSSTMSFRTTRRRSVGGRFPICPSSALPNLRCGKHAFLSYSKVERIAGEGTAGSAGGGHRIPQRLGSARQGSGRRRCHLGRGPRRPATGAGAQVGSASSAAPTAGWLRCHAGGMPHPARTPPTSALIPLPRIGGTPKGGSGPSKRHLLPRGFQSSLRSRGATPSARVRPSPSSRPRCSRRRARRPRADRRSKPARRNRRSSPRLSHAACCPGAFVPQSESLPWSGPTAR